MKGDNYVKFADVGSGDTGMTIIVLLGGRSRSHLDVLFLIFQNYCSSYPIQGASDNVSSICYKSGPIGWVDASVFIE